MDMAMRDGNEKRLIYVNKKGYYREITGNYSDPSNYKSDFI